MRHLGSRVGRPDLLRRVFRRRKRYTIHLENVLGTSLALLFVARDDEAARRAERAACEEIERLAGILSGYIPTSELARWQETLGCDAVVSAELAELLAVAEQWRRRTNGAFNAATPAIVDRLVAGGDVLDVLSYIDKPLWSIDEARGVARRLVDVPISLDAIAKGFIVSRAASAAAAIAGVRDVVVNIGGDIQHVGAYEHVIGVADPRDPSENASPVARVRIRNQAVATSGGYRRGFVAQGERHSHIVDPRSGRPVARVISASVVAGDCTTADILSTVLSVLTPDESLALTDELEGVACLIVARDETIITNSLWKELEGA